LYIVASFAPVGTFDTSLWSLDSICLLGLCVSCALGAVALGALASVISGWAALALPDAGATALLCAFALSAASLAPLATIRLCTPSHVSGVCSTTRLHTIANLATFVAFALRHFGPLGSFTLGLAMIAWGGVCSLIGVPALTLGALTTGGSVLIGLVVCDVSMGIACRVLALRLLHRIASMGLVLRLLSKTDRGEQGK